MKQVPQVFDADSVHEWKHGCFVRTDRHPSGFFLARPLSMGGLYTRLKIAYHVFTGKYDALKWNGDV